MQCDKKDFTDRINRISGQIKAIDRMYGEKRSASEILQQLVAVRSSLASLARVIVEAEVKGCLSAENEDKESMSKLMDTLFKVT